MGYQGIVEVVSEDREIRFQISRDSRSRLGAAVKSRAGIPTFLLLLLDLAWDGERAILGIELRMEIPGRLSC